MSSNFGTMFWHAYVRDKTGQQAHCRKTLLFSIERGHRCAKKGATPHTSSALQTSSSHQTVAPKAAKGADVPSQTSDSTVACRPDSRKVPAPKEKATRLKITMNLNSLSLRRRRPASGSRVHQVCSQRFRMVPGTPASGLSYLTW